MSSLANCAWQCLGLMALKPELKLQKPEQSFWIKLLKWIKLARQFENKFWRPNALMLSVWRSRLDSEICKCHIVGQCWASQGIRSVLVNRVKTAIWNWLPVRTFDLNEFLLSAVKLPGWARTSKENAMGHYEELWRTMDHVVHATSNYAGLCQGP